MKIEDKIEAKGVRFKPKITILQRLNWVKISSYTIVYLKLKKDIFLKKILLEIDNITLDPDPNSMYLDPQS